MKTFGPRTLSLISGCSRARTLGLGMDKVTKMGLVVVGCLGAAIFWLVNFSSWAREQSTAETACTSLLRSPLCYFLGGTAEYKLSEMQEKLRDLYLSRLDQWVSSNAKPETIQTQVVENCGKLMMVLVSAEQQKAFMGPARDELDTRVDICTKITVHRVSPQPEFSNPKILKLVCHDMKSVFHNLCERANLAR